MGLFLVVILNIIFLPVHLIIKSRLKKSRVMTRKTASILNGFLILLLATYILLHYMFLYSFVLEGFFDPTVSTVITTSTVFLIFSPYFWVSSLHFLGKIFLYTRINMKARVTGSILYYRDDLAKVHPGLLSLVYNFRAGERSDITAVILKLKQEGYVTEQGGRLLLTEKNTYDLLSSEKLVHSAVGGSPFDLSQYISTVKDEAKAHKLISGAGGSASVRAAKVFLSFMLPFAVIISIWVGAAVLSSTYTYHPNRVPGNRALFVEVDEAVYDEHYFMNQTEGGIISRFVRDSKNPATYTRDGKFYVRADLAGGIHAYFRNSDAMSVAMGIATILSVYMMIILISLVSSQVKSFKYDFARTGAGYKLINDAMGLKNFLKEFSVIERRTADELVLWEYYLIYAVVLEVNMVVEDKVISMFLDSLGR